MLFTEQELSLKISDPFSILDESVYLTEKEATIYPSMVPIVENNRLQAYVVDFNGIKQLSESSGLNYLDAAVLVAEQEGIDPSQVCVAIDEADIIQFPELSDIGLPIVVIPISEQSLIYQVCEALTEEYFETENEALLEDLSRQEMDRLIQVMRKFAMKRGKIPVSLADPKWFPRFQVAFKAAIRRAGMDSGNGMRLSDDMVEDLANFPGKHLRRRLDNPKKFKRSIEAVSRDVNNPYRTNKAVLRLANYLGRKLKKEEESKPAPQVPETPPQEPHFGGSNGGGNVPPPKSGSGGSLVPKSGFNGGGNVPPPKSGSGRSNGGSSNGGGNVPPPKSGSNGMSFGKKAAIGAGIAAAIGGGVLAYQHYKNKPKSVIAKRIAALRSIYQKWMAKASSSKDSGLAAKLRRVAAKILQVIDKLMSFLQRKADGR